MKEGSDTNGPGQGAGKDSRNVFSFARVLEDSLKIVLGMLFAAIGGTVAWGMATVILHDREITRQKSKDEAIETSIQVAVENGNKAIEEARKRDEEMITMMAEEIKKLKKAVETALVEQSRPTKVDVPYVGPIEVPKKTTKETFNKFFPPDQRTEDYQRILRDKLDQRTQQHRMNAPASKLSQ